MPTREATAVSKDTFAADVRRGLERDGQKELPAKYLYDDVGSALFEVISVLPEYGLTRADERLLRRHADEIVGRVRSPVMVAELGSGSARKTRWILEALCRRQPTTYCPVEISPSALASSRRELAHLKSLNIVSFEREYLDGLLEVAARRPSAKRLLVLFLGSTIGNFGRAAGENFLKDVRRVLGPGDAFLLGTDLEKPVAQLIPAYDDPLGVTAAFNLNLLARINRELDGEFDLRKFQHAARYNEQERRIEMHLRSTADQGVSISAANFTAHFREGETIWTESSLKFNPGEVAAMAERAGFRCDAQWIDGEWPFAESLLVAT